MENTSVKEILNKKKPAVTETTPDMFSNILGKVNEPVKTSFKPTVKSTVGIGTTTPLQVNNSLLKQAKIQSELPQATFESTPIEKVGIQANAGELDEEMIKKFIQRGKDTGKSKEEIKIAYNKALNDGIFDIGFNGVPKSEAPQEELPQTLSNNFITRGLNDTGNAIMSGIGQAGAGVLNVGSKLWNLQHNIISGDNAEAMQFENPYESIKREGIVNPFNPEQTLIKGTGEVQNLKKTNVGQDVLQYGAGLASTAQNVYFPVVNTIFNSAGETEIGKKVLENPAAGPIIGVVIGSLSKNWGNVIKGGAIGGLPVVVDSAVENFGSELSDEDKANLKSVITDGFFTYLGASGKAQKYKNEINKGVSEIPGDIMNAPENISKLPGTFKEKLQIKGNEAAEGLLASDWKLSKPVRKELKGKIGQSGPEFALKNDLVGPDIETTADNAGRFKLEKIQEKIEAVKNFGETETPEVAKRMSATLSNKILEDTKKSYGVKEDIQALDLLRSEHPEFGQVYDLALEINNSKTVNYSKLEQLKELYDHLNPENLKFDVTGKPENAFANQLVAQKRGKLQKILEDAGTRNGVDIKAINKDIQGAHTLEKGLNDTVSRKENLNIFGLGDMQTAIISGILGGPTGAVGGVLLRRGLNSESFKGGLAKKLYSNQTKNENSNSANSDMMNTSPISRVGRIMNNDNSVSPTEKVTARKLLLPAEGESSFKKSAIITPQTQERAIIQESKQGLDKTKSGLNSDNSSAKNYEMAKEIIQKTEDLNSLNSLKTEIKDLYLKRESELLKEIDDKILGIESMNQLEGGMTQSFNNQYGKDLIDKFKTVYQNELNTIKTKSGDKYTTIEFNKTPSFKNFSKSAEEYLSISPWENVTIQGLYDKMKYEVGKHMETLKNEKKYSLSKNKNDSSLSSKLKIESETNKNSKKIETEKPVKDLLKTKDNKNSNDLADAIGRNIEKEVKNYEDKKALLSFIKKSKTFDDWDSMSDEFSRLYPDKGPTGVEVMQKIIENDLNFTNKKVEVEVPKEINKQIEVLPKEISLETESKKVGPKRISPDRVTHQQLIPEESIKKLKTNINESIKEGDVLAETYMKRYNDISGSQKKYDDYLKYEKQVKEGTASHSIQRYVERNKDYFRALKTKLFMQDILGKKYSNFKESLKLLKDISEEDIKKSYIDLVKKDISKGYKFPEDVLNYDKSFKTALDNRARYEKGLNTSFSADDSRIIFDDRTSIGMKRQDGKDLTQLQKDEIVNGINDIKDTTGVNLEKILKDDKIVIAHLNGKHPFLTKKASGLYREDMNGNKSVSVGGVESFKEKNPTTGEMDTKNVNTTMAHEFGHTLDHLSKDKLFNNFVGDYTRNFNREGLSYNELRTYWRTPVEVKARLFAQYVAVKKGHTDTYNKVGNWDKETFSKIMPYIEKGLKEHFSEYIDTK